MLFIYNQLEVFKDIVIGLCEALAILNIPYKFTNSLIKDTSNKNLYICFGLHKHEVVDPLPKRYIVYQLEQTGSTSSSETRQDWFNKNYLQILNKAEEVWDYSIKNIQNLKQKYNLINVKYVPLTYMPCLDNIPRNDEKTIDVLFYGSTNHRRTKIMNDLKNIGIKAEFFKYNLWKDELREKISQSKIVLNIHFYSDPILETSRLSYLIANNCFVISEPSTDPILDKEYSNYLVFAKYDHLVETCIKYLVKKDEREEICNRGYALFKNKKYQNYIPLANLKKYMEEVNDDEETLGNVDESRENKKQKLPDVEFKYKFAEKETNSDGDEILKLPNIDFGDLPHISIVTLTYNRSEMLEIAVRNFNKFIYPEDKIEWVIVDDSNKRHKALNQKILPLGDPRIRYLPLDKRIPISEKRNIGVNEAHADIIVHMDDDDYYNPQSLPARVKLLTKYAPQGIGCVGCLELGVYNILENYSYLIEAKFPAEASLAYTKEFWAQCPFPSEDVLEGEGIPFLYKRTEQVVIMPYMFNLIAITHNKNITGKLRTLQIDAETKYTNFYNLWDFETQLFFLDILDKIKKETK